MDAMLIALLLATATPDCAYDRASMMALPNGRSIRI
jgi:hypothetical protein